MKTKRTSDKLTDTIRRLNLDHKLAAYLTASASIGAFIGSEAKGVVVSNSTPVAFGLVESGPGKNDEVNIDFNGDGATDFQIDHDRVNVGGNNLDFLQLDKNDVTSSANPYGPFGNDVFIPFANAGSPANADHGYMTNGGSGDLGFYPKALISGAEIGPLADNWDFQEGDGFGINQDPVKGLIHANRLIDEDATQVDAANPSPPAGKVPTLPFGSPGWVGFENQTRYLGVRLDFNDSGHAGFNNDNSQYWYGWIGVKITNEADATGEVTGWGYESQIGMPINAGAVAPGVAGDYNGNGKVDAADYVSWRNGGPLQNDATPGVQAGDYGVWKAQFGQGSGSGAGLSAVPEPSSFLLGLGMGVAMLGTLVLRRIRGFR